MDASESGIDSEVESSVSDSRHSTLNSLQEVAEVKLNATSLALHRSDSLDGIESIPPDSDANITPRSGDSAAHAMVAAPVVREVAEINTNDTPISNGVIVATEIENEANTEQNDERRQPPPVPPKPVKSYSFSIPKQQIKLQRSHRTRSLGGYNRKNKAAVTALALQVASENGHDISSQSLEEHQNTDQIDGQTAGTSANSTSSIEIDNGIVADSATPPNKSKLQSGNKKYISKRWSLPVKMSHEELAIHYQSPCFKVLHRSMTVSDHSSEHLSSAEKISPALSLESIKLPVQKSSLNVVLQNPVSEENHDDVDAVIDAAVTAVAVDVVLENDADGEIDGHVDKSKGKEYKESTVSKAKEGNNGKNDKKTKDGDSSTDYSDIEETVEDLVSDKKASNENTREDSDNVPVSKDTDDSKTTESGSKRSLRDKSASSAKISVRSISPLKQAPPPVPVAPVIAGVTLVTAVSSKLSTKKNGNQKSKDITVNSDSAERETDNNMTLSKNTDQQTPPEDASLVQNKKVHGIDNNVVTASTAVVSLGAAMMVDSLSTNAANEPQPTGKHAEAVNDQSPEHIDSNNDSNKQDGKGQPLLESKPAIQMSPTPIQPNIVVVNHPVDESESESGTVLSQNDIQRPLSFTRDPLRVQERDSHFHVIDQNYSDKTKHDKVAAWLGDPRNWETHHCATKIRTNSRQFIPRKRKLAMQSELGTLVKPAPKDNCFSEPSGNELVLPPDHKRTDLDAHVQNLVILTNDIQRLINKITARQRIIRISNNQDGISTRENDNVRKAQGLNHKDSSPTDKTKESKAHSIKNEQNNKTYPVQVTTNTVASPRPERPNHSMSLQCDFSDFTIDDEPKFATCLSFKKRKLVRDFEIEMSQGGFKRDSFPSSRRFTTKKDQEYVRLNLKILAQSIGPRWKIFGRCLPVASFDSVEGKLCDIDKHNNKTEDKAYQVLVSWADDDCSRITTAQFVILKRALKWSGLSSVATGLNVSEQ